MKTILFVILDIINKTMLTILTLGTVRGSDDWPILKAPVAKHCVPRNFSDGGEQQ